MLIRAENPLKKPMQFRLQVSRFAEILLLFAWALAMLLTLAQPGKAQAEETLPRTAVAQCDRPWIFFDLGNTLIDTRDSAHYHYEPQAKAYLDHLLSKGYQLGLITNVPDEWGADAAQKLDRLKSMIQGNWDEPAPFDWSAFSMVVVPLSESERKPAPILFQRVQQAVAPCPVTYQGEDHLEVRTAAGLGFQTYLVGSTGQPFFLPL